MPMKRLFLLSLLCSFFVLFAMSMRGAASSEDSHEEGDSYVHDVDEEAGGDEEASEEEEEAEETGAELETAPSDDLYKYSDSYFQDFDKEEDSEDEASEEEEEAEEEEPELNIPPPPKWDVKYKIDKQLGDTGLEFDPYAPVGEAAPKESSYKKFPAVEPMVLVPDEQEQAAEIDQEKQEEKEIDEEKQEEKGEDNHE